MDTLKLLEYEYSKDYHGYFEDLAALLFCIEYNQTHGVNRRINQPGIEADPIVVGGKKIAFQAKYYNEGVSLSDRKNDLLKCVEEAARERVDKLIIYTNKDLSTATNQKNNLDKTTPREKPAYEREIDDLAKQFKMSVEWQTRSSINTTLEKKEFAYIRKIYFGSADSKVDLTAFYSYAKDKMCSHDSNSIFGDISLKDGYLEPYIRVNKNNYSLKDYLYEWVSLQNKEIKDQIIVICGEPGHGKTSLCYKAMYDFFATGWLSGIVHNTFHISLNPTETDVNLNGNMKIADFLCWGELRENKLNTSDFKNSLVFLDGFDELLDYMPNLTLAEFINNSITRFVNATNAKIVITSRRMSIERELHYDYSTERYYIQDAPQYPVFELQKLSHNQQINWIQSYSEYCEEQALQDPTNGTYWKEKADNLKTYKELFDKQTQSIVYSNHFDDSVLFIPLVFRIIVENQYPPHDFIGSVELYDDLFNRTWERRPKPLSGVDDKMSKEQTIVALAAHAFNCFQEGSDSAIADIGIKDTFFWTYQFYTKAMKNPDNITNPPTKMQSLLRVGFLHRSFYQYFLAKHVILTLINPQSQNEEYLKEFLARLSKGYLDFATLQYIKKLYNLLGSYEKAYSEKTIEIVSNIIKTTDAFLPEIYTMRWVNQNSVPEIITPLEACNNLFSNISSIYTITGHSNASDFCSSFALRHYSLRKANLESWNLDGLELYGANFEEANLKGASFKNTNLKGAFLRSACLSNACLKGANLKRAYLGYASFDNVHCEQANFESAQLEKAHLEGTHLEKANLERALLEEAHLEKANLKGAHLVGANFDRAHLEGAHLEAANLKGAYLKGAHLEGANLVGANLEGAHLEGAHLVGAHMEGTFLVGADLSMASLNGAYMRGAYFDGTQADETGIWKGTSCGGAILNETVLKGARLKSSFLSEEQYRYARTREALGLPHEIPDGKRLLQAINLRAQNRMIPFGKYYKQGTKKETLYWRVLRREYDKVFMITEELIDCQVYNKTYAGITWEHCDLRKWLNEDFLNEAFSEKERSAIEVVCNQNPNNKRWGTKGGNPTWDRVFALSIDEAQMYFKDVTDRCTAVTPYAKSRGSYISDSSTTTCSQPIGCWWLRSSGISSDFASFVSIVGGINEGGNNVDHDDVSVRPALWMRL